MKAAWKRVPKNPRRGGLRRATAKEVMARVPSSAIYRTLVRLGVAPSAAAAAVAKENPKRRPLPKSKVTKSGLRIYPVWDRKGKLRWVTIPGSNPVTRAKARTILHHGHAGGYALTPRQRGLFGAIASGYRLREYRNPPPPIKLEVLANGRRIGQRLIGFRPTRGRKVSRNPHVDIRLR